MSFGALSFFFHSHHTTDKVKDKYLEGNIYQGIDEVMAVLRQTNALVQDAKPGSWLKAILARCDDAVLHVALEVLRVSGIVLQPVIPVLAQGSLDNCRYCTIVSSCGGDVLQVRVDPCEKLPCTFKKGRSAKIEMDFHSVNNQSSVSVGIMGKSHGVLLPLPFNQKDGCTSSGLDCPLQAGRNYTVARAVKVYRIYPKGMAGYQLLLRWLLLGAAACPSGALIGPGEEKTTAIFLTSSGGGPVVASSSKKPATIAGRITTRGPRLGGRPRPADANSGFASCKSRRGAVPDMEPLEVLSSLSSPVQCLAACLLKSPRCKGFAFGNRSCDLLQRSPCDSRRPMRDAPGFAHYDVLTRDQLLVRLPRRNRSFLV
ncbi:hypothetical protein HPB52_020624 [Rhipicephalus sanguineus]|uniref:Apple domain-containing protein n=1 Tax=Rhipicephalus sanguineus TaxID=34632 RepID=A0A9D4Q3C8_RHISA|nr:hypothetical protein HPB52_020624 [Rhipicephalus sanguineus]